MQKIPDDAPYEQFEMKMGLCMISATNGKETKIRKELGIDLNDADGFEKLGEKMGESLVFSCPKFMKFMLAALSDENSGLADEIMDDVERENPMLIESGTVTDVLTSPFLMLKVKTSKGVETFYALREFRGIDIANMGKTLVGKKLSIEYRKISLFDPNTGGFEFRNEILSMEIAY